MARARAMSEKDAIAHQKKMGKPLKLSDIAGKPAKDAMKRRSKFGNEVTVVDGVRMASKREAKRYRELGLLLKSGEIDFLARQVRFRLPGGVEYVADFVYGNRIGRGGGGSTHVTFLTVEDVKSSATAKLATFRIKKKQMLALHGIDVKEV